MIRRIAMSFAGALVLYAASAEADEHDCIVARDLAAGKYEACELKALGRYSSATAIPCRQKAAEAWTRLGTKYPGTSCVGARFVDNGLTITDNLLQLVWEKKTTAIDSGVNASDRHDVDNVYSWSATSTNSDGTVFTDFLDDLNSTGFGGQHDWRLPTLVEINSIQATNEFPCGSPPCIVDPLFVPTQWDTLVAHYYWSSWTEQTNDLQAWGGLFEAGSVGADDKTLNYYVRAVRGGF